MTRSKIDAWTWFCDQCGTGSGDLAHEQSGPHGLPTPDEMRARGWYIAPKWGDLCPKCVKDSAVGKAVREQIALDIEAAGESSGVGAFGDYGPPSIAVADAARIARGVTSDADPS